MARPNKRRLTGETSSRRGRPLSRHGRGMRNVVTGPYLPPLTTRIILFESTVASMAEYLLDLWPEELAEVRFEVAGLPAGSVSEGGYTLLLWSPH